MAIQKTLSIIKPDAVSRNLIGNIASIFEENDLRIVAQKRLKLTKSQSEKFYAVHKERPFYSSLCDYMSSGPVVVMVLAGENAVAKNRTLMGATNPADAAEGTIRRLYGIDIEHNAVHGSDSEENAKNEVSFFFSQLEIEE